MTKSKAEKAFNAYVSSAVGYYKRKNAEHNFDLASALDCSESFIKQANTNLNGKHYNAYHLWLLAKHFDVDVSELYPPRGKQEEDFMKYCQIRPNATRQSFYDFVELLGQYYDTESN